MGCLWVVKRKKRLDSQVPAGFILEYLSCYINSTEEQYLSYAALSLAEREREREYEYSRGSSISVLQVFWSYR